MKSACVYAAYAQNKKDSPIIYQPNIILKTRLETTTTRLTVAHPTRDMNLRMKKCCIMLQTSTSKTTVVVVLVLTILLVGAAMERPVVTNVVLEEAASAEEEWEEAWVTNANP